jgi:hypothetical protein
MLIRKLGALDPCPSGKRWSITGTLSIKNAEVISAKLGSVNRVTGQDLESLTK